MGIIKMNSLLPKFILCYLVLHISCESNNKKKVSQFKTKKTNNVAKQPLLSTIDATSTHPNFSINKNAVSICSWNLCDFGITKNDMEIDYISNQLKDFDIVLIQEVVAGDGGADAVIRLFNTLNTKGAKWDYTLSNPTTTISDSKNKCERYAFLWKSKIVKQIGNAWLEDKYNSEIEREPFFCTFKFNKNQEEFTLVNFHAITKTQQPEREIKYFKFMPTEYENLHLLFCGDFNCNEKNTVFIPLGKLGFVPVFSQQKTSLKVECEQGECLASAFDNAYYDSKYFEVANNQIIPFYKDFNDNLEARKISDHVPIFFQLNFK